MGLPEKAAKMSKLFQMNRVALTVTMNSPKQGRLEELTALTAVLVFSTLVLAIYIAAFVDAMGA